MKAMGIDILKKLDKEDQEKVLHFIELLLKQQKYKKLREEIEIRKEEIEKGETLSHEEIWKQLNV